MLDVPLTFNRARWASHESQVQSLEDRVLRTVVGNSPGDLSAAGTRYDNPARLAVRHVALELTAPAVFLEESFEVAEKRHESGRYSRRNRSSMARFRYSRQGERAREW